MRSKVVWGIVFGLALAVMFATVFYEPWQTLTFLCCLFNLFLMCLKDYLSPKRKELPAANRKIRTLALLGVVPGLAVVYWVQTIPFDSLALIVLVGWVGISLYGVGALELAMPNGIFQRRLPPVPGSEGSGSADRKP